MLAAVLHQPTAPRSGSFAPLRHIASPDRQAAAESFQLGFGRIHLPAQGIFHGRAKVLTGLGANRTPSGIPGGPITGMPGFQPVTPPAILPSCTLSPAAWPRETTPPLAACPGRAWAGSLADARRRLPATPPVRSSWTPRFRPLLVANRPRSSTLAIRHRRRCCNRRPQRSGRLSGRKPDSAGRTRTGRRQPESTCHDFRRQHQPNHDARHGSREHRSRPGKNPAGVRRRSRGPSES